MSKGGGGGNTTTVQKSDPWSGQQPYLTQGLQTAGELFFSPSSGSISDGTFSGGMLGQGGYHPAYFDQNAAGVPAGLNAHGTVAGWTPLQQSGLQNMLDTAQFNHAAIQPVVSANADMGRFGFLNGANPGNALYGGVSQNAMGNPANAKLAALMGGDAVPFSQSNGLLSLSGNATQNPALQMLNPLASGDVQQHNLGNSYLSGAYGNAQGIFPEVGQLQGMAGQAAQNPALGLLNPLAKGDPQGANIGNDFLTGSALRGGAGNDTLERYAGGGMLGSENPAWKQLTQSVSASVLPQLEGQFTQGGAMNNPNAQYEIANGLSSALAPYAEQNYNTQTQNQLNAASTLAGNSLGASGQLASSILGGQQLQGQTANDLASQYTSSLANAQNALTSAGSLFNTSIGNQINAAGQLAGTVLGGQQLQGQTAGQLGSQYTADLANAGNLLTNSGNLYNNAISNVLGATGQLGSNFNSGMEHMLGAAQGLSGNYNTGNQQAIQSQIALPGLLGASNAQASLPFEAGGAQQGQNQAELTDMVNRWNYNQNLPLNMLNAYNSAISGNFGGTSSLTQPYFSNPLANAMGTGMGALGLYNMAKGAGIFGGLGGAGAGAGLIGDGIGAAGATTVADALPALLALA